MRRKKCWYTWSVDLPICNYKIVYVSYNCGRIVRFFFFLSFFRSCCCWIGLPSCSRLFNSGGFLLAAVSDILFLCSALLVRFFFVACDRNVCFLFGFLVWFNFDIFLLFVVMSLYRWYAVSRVCSMFVLCASSFRPLSQLLNIYLSAIASFCYSKSIFLINTHRKSEQQRRQCE